MTDTAALRSGASFDAQQLRALLAAATPGPWSHGRTNWRKQRVDWWGIFPPRRLARLPMFSLPPVAYLEDEQLDQPDAALIVAAVNALPALLDENEALRAALNWMEKSVEEHLNFTSDESEREVWNALDAARAALEATPDGGVE